MDMVSPIAGSVVPPPNDLLAALSNHERERLARHLRTWQVLAGTVLYDAGQVIQTLYFPHDCLISLLAVVDGTMTLEVAQVGAEGMLGSAVALGNAVSPMRAVVQKDGIVSGIESVHFCLEFKKNAALQRLLYRYTDTLLNQVMQLAVCSHFHLLGERLARMLLVTRERVQADKFHMTHAFLAQALGVRRVGVTKAASVMQSDKLISYSRGNIEILDLPGLLKVACGCYQILREIQKTSASAAAF